ncbi:MAG: AraC family transcriptional regulator [Clostridiales bacterium]|nr:AraC family transcriptional regulator [Clostridiales bacterium]
MNEISLNDLEQSLKQIYTQHPQSGWTMPVEEKEFQHDMQKHGIDLNSLFPVPLSAYLSEEHFIPDDRDVAVLRHFRYMPAFFHSHDFFEITYVFEGECTNYFTDTSFSMRIGDFCLIAPDTKHAISAVTDDCVILNLLIRASTFDTAFFDLLSGRDVLTAFFTRALYGSHKNAALLFPTGNDTALKDFISYAYQEYQDKSRYFQRMMNNLIHAICILLLRNHEKDVIILSGTEDSMDENLIYILNYIQANYSHITLSNLARFFHYSERHMSRLIKENTGKHFSDLVRDLKLSKATDLLKNPELTIAEIVEQIGYSDVSGFYRAFKRKYEITPVEYRSKLQL